MNTMAAQAAWPAAATIGLKYDTILIHNYSNNSAVGGTGADDTAERCDHRSRKIAADH